MQLPDISWQLWAIYISTPFVYTANFQLGYETGIKRRVLFDDTDQQLLFRQRRGDRVGVAIGTTALYCIFLLLFLATLVEEYHLPTLLDGLALLFLLTVMPYLSGKKKNVSVPYDWKKEMSKIVAEKINN